MIQSYFLLEVDFIAVGKGSSAREIIFMSLFLRQSDTDSSKYGDFAEITSI